MQVLICTAAYKYVVMYMYILGVGLNAVPGGFFPLPSEVAHLMSIIPPPQCFSVSHCMGCDLLHEVWGGERETSLMKYCPRT